MDFPAKLHIAALVVLCFAAPGVSDQSLETFTAAYGPFNSFAVSEVKPLATVRNDELQKTPDRPSADSDLNEGRVMLKRRFKLLQGTKGSYLDLQASFYSSFLVNISCLNGSTVGEGLVFVVAQDLNQPSNSSGQYLGLTNSTTDGHAANRLLDTFKEEFDPDANHVGLNVNIVVSRSTTSLTPLKIQRAPLGEASFFNVWVDYNGVSKAIEVYIAQIPTKNGQIPLRPAEPVLKEYVDLREVVNHYSYFGFSAPTGKTGVQLICILDWNLTADYYPEGLYQVDNKSRRWKKILFEAGVSLLAVLLTAALVLGFYRRKKRRAESSKSGIVEAGCRGRQKNSISRT